MISKLDDLTAGALGKVPARSTLLIPIGSTEQHGPHLPFGTDTYISIALADELQRLRPDRTVVAPALPYGSSGEHAAVAGTLSIGQAALEHVVVELVRSADQFNGVVVVSAHGGNLEPISRAGRKLSQEGREILYWYPTVTALQGAAERWSLSPESRGLWQPDLHAGRTETSIMLALHPGLVGSLPAITGPDENHSALIDRIRSQGILSVSKSGVLGDPGGANSEEGCAILAAFVDDLVGQFDRYVAEGLPKSRGTTVER